MRNPSLAYIRPGLQRALTTLSLPYHAKHHQDHIILDTNGSTPSERNPTSSLFRRAAGHG